MILQLVLYSSDSSSTVTYSIKMRSYCVILQYVQHAYVFLKVEMS